MQGVIAARLTCFQAPQTATIAAGLDHTCDIRIVDGKAGGEVRCWGKNQQGQLGKNDQQQLGDTVTGTLWGSRVEPVRPKFPVLA